LVEQRSKIRVGAVSYLNTVPLIWGMLRGEEQSVVDLSFSIPSVCAAEIAEGTTDIGLVPVSEIARQGLEIMADVGIAAQGAVRSILLISRVPWHKIRSLAADLSSRTSVQLAKVILREKFGVEPEITEQSPDWREMLSNSDAALVIGDPALRIEPENLPYEHLDLAAEWQSLTGLPMVFAAWAGKPGVPDTGFREVALRSYQFGMAHLPDILGVECSKREISRALGERYFAQYIRFPLGPRELEGLHQFWALSRAGTPLTIGHSK
jgi:predicted solute-binding protein